MRYIAQFARGGFPELYAVVDTVEHCRVSDPQPYHQANDEAHARNQGTWGKPAPVEEAAALWGWTLPASPVAP